jgi:hypothetical protein
MDMEARLRLPGIPRGNEYAVRWLAHALFPLIVVSTMLNQERPYPFLMLVGQLASITCVAIAAALPIAGLPGRIWPVVLAGATVALRVARVMLGENALVMVAYALVVGLEFCAAAAVVAIVSPVRLRRQMLVFVILSLVFMLLQLLGVGAWTQVLRTDFHAHGEETLKQYATLFVAYDDLAPTTIQLRPAGLMSANNVFSVFLVVALAFHYGSPHSGRITWRDITLCVATTVAMAKIGVLALIVFLLALLASGNPSRRWLAVKVAAIFCVSVFAYAVLFPGAFELNMTIDIWWLNFQIRAIDWLFATGRPELGDLIGAFGASQDLVARAQDRAGTESGYAVLAPYMTIVLTVIAMLIFLFWRGLRTMAGQYGAWASISRLSGIAVLLVPLISPLLETNIFAFLAGIALIPAFLRVDPRYRRLFAMSDLREFAHRSEAIAGSRATA